MRVVFKSFPEFWKKEKEGIRPSTVRKVDKDDRRFKLLKEGKATMIKIINTETKESFYREIKDVTFWKDLCIISWEHETHYQTNASEVKE